MTSTGPAPAILFALLAGLLIALPASAEPVVRYGGISYVPTNGPAAALVQKVSTAPTATTMQNGASLFAGRAGNSLFAAPNEAARSSRRARPTSEKVGTLMAFGPADSQADRIRHIIGHAESRRDGYDAIVYNANIRPARRPTALTIAEIYQWIADTPGQNHAIGRYQFIPKTLKRLVRKAGVAENTVFSPQLQDHLADILLEEAGLGTFRAGGMDRHQFMNNLATIWAGLPTSSGESHYHGYAGNKATMSWQQYDAEMARIFPG